MPINSRASQIKTEVLSNKKIGAYFHMIFGVGDFEELLQSIAQMKKVVKEELLNSLLRHMVPGVGG